MSLPLVSILVASLSLLVSGVTAWLTVLKRGTIKLVRPALVAFLDAGGVDGPKVWFRGLLYSTSRSGNVLESMFVRLRRGEARQNFSFWVCGERSTLASGCGLYVGHTGVALDHHFVLPKDGSRFEFLAGDYVVEVFASLVNRRALLLLQTINLHVTEDQARALKNPAESLYFDWWPDSASYNAHVVRRREPAELPEVLAALLGGKKP